MNKSIRKNIVWGGMVALIVGLAANASAQVADPMEPQPCLHPSCQAGARPAASVREDARSAAPRQVPPPVNGMPDPYAGQNFGAVGMSPADRVRMEIATPHHVRVARYYAQRGMQYMVIPPLGFNGGFNGGFNRGFAGGANFFFHPTWAAREIRRFEREESIAAPMLRGETKFLDNVHVYLNGCMKGRGDDFNNPRLGDHPFPMPAGMVNEIVLVTTTKDKKSKTARHDARVMYVLPEDMASYETTSNGVRKFFSLPAAKRDFEKLPKYDFDKLSAPGACTAPGGD